MKDTSQLSHDQISTKECAGRRDRTLGRLHAKRTASNRDTAPGILPLPLIQEEQLAVTGERMCT